QARIRPVAIRNADGCPVARALALVRCVNHELDLAGRMMWPLVNWIAQGSRSDTRVGQRISAARQAELGPAPRRDGRIRQPALGVRSAVPSAHLGFDLYFTATRLLGSSLGFT